MAKKATRSPKMPAKTPSWQVIENVVAALERIRIRMPGMIVTQKAQVPRLNNTSKTREIDVLVEIPVGDRTMSIGIDVKNHGRPVTIEQMGTSVR